MLKALRMDGLVNADRKVVELLDRVLEDGTTSDVIPVGKKKDGSYTGYSKVASSEQFNVIRTYTRKKVREIGEGIFSKCKNFAISAGWSNGMRILRISGNLRIRSENSGI